MQTFFNTTEPIGQAVFQPPQWSYLNDGLKRNLQTVKDYYKIRPFAVKSNHFLARLLNNLGVSYNLNLERFYDIADARASTISMGFKMTSSVYRGSHFKDVFYGGNISEIFILDEEYCDPYETYKNWMDVSAVKVLMHPKSDLNLLMPNGKSYDAEPGVAVISINIAKLAVQFKAFLDREEKRMNELNESPKTVAQFIHMFVLPNMLDSQLDIALFNRVYNLVTNSPMREANKKHPFFLTDYSKMVDKVYSDIVDVFSSSDKRYKVMLKSFPCVSVENFEKLMVLPDNAPTRQIIWSQVVARVKVLELLVKLSPNNGNSLNKADNNTFSRNFKLYENDKALSDLVQSSNYYELIKSIADVKTLIQ